MLITVMQLNIFFLEIVIHYYSKL